jgi:hypothetical protein
MSNITGIMTNQTGYSFRLVSSVMETGELVFVAEEISVETKFIEFFRAEGGNEANGIITYMMEENDKPIGTWKLAFQVTNNKTDFCTNLMLPPGVIITNDCPLFGSDIKVNFITL